MTITTKVWTGKKMKVITGRLLDFPFDVPDRPYIKLLNRQRKWWIYYGKDHQTGDFSSKKKAVAWIKNGGR